MNTHGNLGLCDENYMDCCQPLRGNVHRKHLSDLSQCPGFGATLCHHCDLV